jgi:hypothetical protein
MKGDSLRFLGVIGLLMAAIATGCSSSNSGGGPPPVISVTLSPSIPQTIQQNQTVNVLASVQGSSNKAVSWKLDGVGSLTAQTSTSVTYLAPSPVTSVETVTVTATAAADSTKTASVQVRIDPPAVPFAIQSVLPPSANPGGSAFTLTVNGTGFASDATVNFDGVPLQTIFASGHQLSASVPASDIAAAGTASITIKNPGAGLQSNAILFPIASAETSFSLSNAPAAPFPLGRVINDVAAADFNRDGIPDLAVVDDYINGSVNILLGVGDGTFIAASNSPISVPDPPSWLMIGDVNGDGRPDLVIPSQLGNSLTVLLGNGDGTFAMASGSPHPVGQNPLMIALGDFNGDGKLDVAVTNANTNDVSILLGNGDGTFADAPGSPFQAGKAPEAIVTADFNGDGNLDLAIVNSPPNTVTLLLGHGDGSFVAGRASPITVGNFPTGIVAADFNGDGKPDLAVTNGFSYNVSILLGNGDGTFTAASGSPVAVGRQPFAINAGDFNNDGILDLAVVNTADNTLTLLSGKGDGTFTTATTPSVTNQPGGTAVADFNGDGRLDLAIVDVFDVTVCVLLQQ